MNHAKVDISKLSEEEKKVFQKYGRLPTGKDLIGHKLKDRKYFDSGDYAMSKAGKTSGPIGTSHPSPENIPHSNPDPHHSSSPVKESGLVHETAAATK